MKLNIPIPSWRKEGLLTLIVLHLSHYSASQDVTNFTCYRCSYTSSGQNTVYDCVNGTHQLAKHYYSLSCDRYCVTHQRWRRQSKTIDSVFRSCDTFLGNECDYNEREFINCVSSCRGHYCNNATVGQNHVINFDCRGPMCSTGTRAFADFQSIGCKLLLLLVTSKLFSLMR